MKYLHIFKTILYLQDLKGLNSDCLKVFAKFSNLNKKVNFPNPIKF